MVNRIERRFPTGSRLAVRLLALVMMLNGFGAARAGTMPSVQLAAGGARCASRVETGYVEPRLGTAANNRRFLIEFGTDPIRGHGILKRLPLRFDENGTPEIAAKAEWDAGTMLTGIPAMPVALEPARRNLHTARMDGGIVTGATPFRWNELDPDQRAWLNMDPVRKVADGKGEKRLAWLRGDRTEEEGRGGSLNPRQHVLGGLAYGNPVYAGTPSPAMRGDGYWPFFNEYKNRAHAVYLSTNDGMLHAFDPVSGSELFAYLPNALFPVLSAVAGPGTASGARKPPVMDATPAVAEATVRGKWRTVLAAGMGAAAQGIYVLDVTDPARFDQSGAMFEFTDADDPDVGNVTGAPAIARLRTGGAKGKPEYRDFVVFSSGYNNHSPDGAGRFNPAGPGVLFLLSLDKAPGVRWQQNLNFFKFSVPASDPSAANALSPPALAIGPDGAVRYIYAGDLQGNLWRFDFTEAAPWRNAAGAGRPKPVFVATDAAGVRQAITVKPRLAFAPHSGYLILFGTGKFHEDADALPPGFRTQSFYAVHDALAVSRSQISRSALAMRTGQSASAGPGSYSGGAIRIAGDPFSYPNTGTASARVPEKSGWVFDLPDLAAGERSIAEPWLVQGQLGFSTLLPGNGPCERSGRRYVVDVLTGLASGEGTNGIRTASPPVGPSFPIEVRAQSGVKRSDPGNAAGKADSANAGMRRVDRRLFALSGDTPRGVAMREWKARRDLASRRVGWREIVNLQELRNEANEN